MVHFVKYGNDILTNVLCVWFPVLSSVDKGGFIDMLKGADDSLKNTAASNTEPAWSILREDYLKNSKLQDWDRDEEANSEGDCSKEGSD